MKEQPEKQLSGWGWQPEEGVKLSPLFDIPVRPFAIVRWMVASWHVLTTRFLMLILAFATWYWWQPALERCRTFEPGWIMEIYARILFFLVFLDILGFFVSLLPLSHLTPPLPTQKGLSLPPAKLPFAQRARILHVRHNIDETTRLFTSVT